MSLRTREHRGEPDGDARSCGRALRVERRDRSVRGEVDIGRMRAELEAMGYTVSCYTYPPGTHFPPHVHGRDKCDLVVRGRLVANGRELSAGQIFVFARGEPAHVEFLEDSELGVVKSPSVPGDKRSVER